MPIFSSGSGFDAARMRITTSSLPLTVGMVATRSSICRSGNSEADLAVLRLAPLGDVELGHDLEARHERVAVRRAGSPDTCTQSPSMRKRTTVAALLAVGLDVDVGGAARKASMMILGTGVWGDIGDVDRAWTPARVDEPDGTLDRTTWARALERAGGWIPELSVLDV